MNVLAIHVVPLRTVVILKDHLLVLASRGTLEMDLVAQVKVMVSTREIALIKKMIC